MTADSFKQEIADAMRAYEKYVICIDKTPEEFHTALLSLVKKAVKAYETRGANLRHGIAPDKFVTVILSQHEGAQQPLCGIYFNLASPYQKQMSVKELQPVVSGKISTNLPESER